MGHSVDLEGASSPKDNPDHPVSEDEQYPEEKKTLEFVSHMNLPRWLLFADAFVKGSLMDFYGGDYEASKAISEQAKKDNFTFNDVKVSHHLPTVMLSCTYLGLLTI